MSSFDVALDSLKHELMDQKCVKEYFYLKNIIDNNDELRELDNVLRLHQKEMCKNKNNHEVYQKEKLAYESIKKIIENNPVLINYQIAKDEVYSLLVDIKNVLS